jgi:hypothetical protein
MASYLSEFMNRYVMALSNYQKQVEFIEKFTLKVHSFNWNGACLLFLLKFLYDLDSSLSHVFMNLETIKNLK